MLSTEKAVTAKKEKENEKEKRRINWKESATLELIYC